MKEVDQETGEDLNPHESTPLADGARPPRNPEAPWIAPSTSRNPDDVSVAQSKRFAIETNDSDIPSRILCFISSRSSILFDI